MSSGLDRQQLGFERVLHGRLLQEDLARKAEEFLLLEAVARERLEKSWQMLW
jgi:predicted deacetylase